MKTLSEHLLAFPRVLPSRPAPSHRIAPSPRRALNQLLAGLLGAMRARFGERSHASRHRRGTVKRRALLGLELLFKIEEQVLLPALRDHTEDAHVLKSVDLSWREIDLMRDLSLLSGRTMMSNRELVMSVLEGMAQLHTARLQSLLGEADDEAMDWTALERESRALLGRWEKEVEEAGDIEDEEMDPVGLAPR